MRGKQILLVLVVRSHFEIQAVVAERLRRLTRNQIPFGSVGSNPTNCENLLFFIENENFEVLIKLSSLFSIINGLHRSLI